MSVGPSLDHLVHEWKSNHKYAFQFSLMPAAGLLLSGYSRVAAECFSLADLRRHPSDCRLTNQANRRVRVEREVRHGQPSN